ncbi:MAG: dTDP-4-dehydrorhamnose 3,5-epimerase [Lachnospiraceae bacterium]|nr:dTDP-4-dehydrorhamnose 3,5-epimerase [Lachnospiraceae bacterium]
MKIVERKLGCALLEPTLIRDVRGWFQIPFSIQDLQALGLDFRCVYQLNHSYTEEKGVVRGPNYQKRPYNQAKVVRCTKGSFYSVAIDIDPDSPTYRQSCGFLLSQENKRLMYVPDSYAHGFVTLEEDTELEYLTDNQYCYEAAKSFQFDDPEVLDESGAPGIDWTMGGAVVLKREIQSDKNRLAPAFSKIEF